MTATLAFTLADAARAADDDEYYAEAREKLSEPARSAFMRAVDATYTARHPLVPNPTAALSPLDAAVLKFEDRARRSPRVNEVAILDTLGINATRYYQILNRLIDDPAARKAYPVLLARLARVRDARRSARSAHNLEGASR